MATEGIVRVHLAEEVVAGKRLGRHVEHDPRSRAYGVDVATGAPLQLVVHRRHGGIFNQLKIGSCTGNAAAGAINTEPVYHSGARVLHEADAVRLYQAATLLDSIPGSYPPDDTGSTGLAVAKAAHNMGLISSYRHAFGIAQALAALQLGPVITGTAWYESFDQPDDHGIVQIGGQVRGGHEYVAVGYDPATDLVMFDNSWGRGWGLHGAFYYTSRTWATLLEQQGDVTVLVR